MNIWLVHRGLKNLPISSPTLHSNRLWLKNHSRKGCSPKFSRVWRIFKTPLLLISLWNSSLQFKRRFAENSRVFPKAAYWPLCALPSIFKTCHRIWNKYQQNRKQHSFERQHEDGQSDNLKFQKFHQWKTKFETLSIAKQTCARFLTKSPN